MLQRLDMVFTRLVEHGLRVNPNKCQFFLKEVKYLGHVESAEGVAMDPDKISTIVNRIRRQKRRRCSLLWASLDIIVALCQGSPRSLRHCIISPPRRLLNARRRAQQRNQQTIDISRRNGRRKQNAPFNS